MGGRDSLNLASLYQQIEPDCLAQGLDDPEANLTRLEQFWLPLCHKIAHRRTTTTQPIIQGILGSQGTGKTTLCAILSRILQILGYAAAHLSLDDLYLNPEDRQAKFPPSDPRHHYRGAPGTHDLKRGLYLMHQIKTGQMPILLPRFDKSVNQGLGRQSEPETITQLDILLFEGWFVGVTPIEPQMFEHLPDPIAAEINRDYALRINQDLQAYVPLWQYLDSLVILAPTDYHYSQQWRKEAEQKMKQRDRPGMSDAEIEQFVAHFWQSLHPELFIKPLLTHPRPGLVITLNQDHSIKEIINLRN